MDPVKQQVVLPKSSKEESQHSYKFLENEEIERNGKEIHKGKRNDSSRITQANSAFTIAVGVNRYREVGLCAFDLHSPFQVTLSHIADTHNYIDTMSFLNSYEPSEILISDTRCIHPLYSSIERNFHGSSTRIVKIARQYFDQAKGYDDLNRVAGNSIGSSFNEKYIVLASVACLLKYIEFSQGVYIANNTVQIIEKNTNHRLMMDSATISSLELIRSSRDSSEKTSLFGTINTCKTRVGAQLLRSTILNPSSHAGTINGRLDLVDAFLDDSASFFSISDTLPLFVDLNKLMGQIVLIPKVVTPRTARGSVACALGLKHTLQLLPKVTKILTGMQLNLNGKLNLLLTSFIQRLSQSSFTDIQIMIDQWISEECTFSKTSAEMRHYECFAVKPGLNGFLDVSRKAFLDLVQKMEELVSMYKEKYDIICTLHHSAKRSYHVVIPSMIDCIPSIFVQRVRCGKSIACSTKEIECLNNRAQSMLRNIYTLSAQSIQNMLQDIRSHTTDLFLMLESIAMLDMIISFTNVVAINSPDKHYVRPIITERGNFVIQSGRHPIVEKVSNQEFVPNDLYFDPISRFHIISGHNCAGKSTYLKMVALIMILGQCGCYVPADYAYIPIRYRLFTRIGTSDDMEKNSSSFAIEMAETAFIIEASNLNSLVIMDELGRGTSNDEGIAIAWAVCEELIKSKSMVLFATHFNELSTLQKAYSSVSLFHLNSDSECNERSKKHKMIRGQFKNNHYGIQMGKLCGMPTSLLDKSRVVLETIEKQKLLFPKYDTDSPKHSALSDTQRLLGLRYSKLKMSDIRKQLQLVREEKT